MNDRDRVATALLALRLSVFVVMLKWTLDKFLIVGHASRIFENLLQVRFQRETSFNAQL
jgi:putative oxidoreductase